MSIRIKMPNKPKVKEHPPLDHTALYNRMEDETMDTILKSAQQAPKPHVGRKEKADRSKG